MGARSGRHLLLDGCTRLAGLLTLALALAAPAPAQDMKFFRIGTGGTAGTYFPIGGLIANGISNPPGSRACNEGGACGVPGLVAAAIAANGAVANVNDVHAGRLEAGLTQSDIAFWMMHAIGPFADRSAAPDLRAIANLYPEMVHVVVRRDSDIRSIADLKGKRVSLDEQGSGTLADARIILDAFGLSEGALEPFYLKPPDAGRMLASGGIDAFLFVGGVPVSAIAELAAEIDISLVPIPAAEAAPVLAGYPFFSTGEIAGGAYRGVGAVPTVRVGAILMTSARQDEKLIYEVTQALWSANSRKLLDTGHPTGRQIRFENALKGLAIPLHRGAERYYRESGLLPPP